MFYTDHVLVTPQISIEAIYLGLSGHPEVYQKIRSARLSTSDVDQIRSMSNKMLKQTIQQRTQRKVLRARKRLSWGQKMEAKVLVKYLELNEYKYRIRTIGNIVNPNLPFLVTQVDGMAFQGDFPSHVIEIKSINLNDLENAYGYYKGTFFKTKYGYDLSRDSKVYVHLQVSMLLTNLNSADLVIYNALEDKINHVIRVERDDLYLKRLMSNILPKYKEVMIESFTDALNSIINF